MGGDAKVNVEDFYFGKPDVWPAYASLDQFRGPEVIDRANPPVEDCLRAG